jgi:2-polyprenyl-3-methyl-5-hydroxy-6-metoxy-1,4-benzoquinol methylase
MSYSYRDSPRLDVLQIIPADGRIIGSIGCGWGATEAVLVQQGREVHGVDISPEAIERAKSRLSSARVVAPDDRTPFPAASLDGLILADVLEHLPAAWQALEEFAKAVRPGGWVALSVPNMRNIKVFFQFFVRGDWPEESEGIFDSTHLQVMSRRRLERWCASAGLTIEKWYDAYHSKGRYSGILRFIDLATIKLFHFWWMAQLQVRLRKQ